MSKGPYSIGMPNYMDKFVASSNSYSGISSEDILVRFKSLLYSFIEF